MHLASLGAILQSILVLFQTAQVWEFVPHIPCFLGIVMWSKARGKQDSLKILLCVKNFSELAPSFP